MFLIIKYGLLFDIPQKYFLKYFIGIAFCSCPGISEAVHHIGVKPDDFFCAIIRT